MEKDKITSEQVQKLLIIDDERDLCLLLSSLLKKLGYTPEFALTLEDGYKKFASISPDVVFLDLNLTDGSGFTLLPQLKADKPEVKVVIISAYNGQSELEEARQKGAFTFLGKPFRLNQVRQVLQKLYA